MHAFDIITVVVSKRNILCEYQQYHQSREEIKFHTQLHRTISSRDCKSPQHARTIAACLRRLTTSNITCQSTATETNILFTTTPWRKMNLSFQFTIHKYNELQQFVHICGNLRRPCRVLTDHCLCRCTLYSKLQIFTTVCHLSTYSVQH